MKLQVKLHVFCVALSILHFVKADSNCGNGLYQICGAKVSSSNETLNFKDFSDKSELTFFESNITVLPTDFFKNVKNLTTIYLDFVGLTELKKENFDGAEKLTDFYARGNLVKCLNESVFQGAKNLVNISVSSNQIDHVDQNAFQGLEKLELLDVSKNLITEIAFVAKIGSLKYLYINFNQMKVLPDNVFAFNQKLEIVEINYNMIKSLTLKSFANATAVKRMGLIGNQCINKTIIDFHISDTISLESCLHKFNFNESIGIETCKNVEYTFNDTCLVSVNEKLLKLNAQNGTCPDDKNSSVIDNLKKQLLDLNLKLNQTQEEANTNQTKLEKLNMELTKNLTKFTEDLKNCTSMNHSADASKSSGGAFITHFLSFIGGVVCSVILIYGFMVRAAKKRGARDPYSPSNFVAEAYSGF